MQLINIFRTYYLLSTTVIESFTVKNVPNTANGIPMHDSPPIRTSAPDGGSGLSSGQRTNPLSLLIVVPFAALIVLSVGAAAWFALNNGRTAVHVVAQQIRTEELARVRDKLADYLQTPLSVNESNAHAMRAGLLRLDDTVNVQRYFYAVVKANPSLAYSFFGTTEGEFYGARRLQDGGLQIVRAGQVTGGDSHNFSTNEYGDALELEQVYKNFDPRTRPWYKTGVAAGGPVWTPIYRHFVIKDLALTASQPFYGPDEELLGVFAVDYVLDQVRDFLQTIDVSDHGEVFVMQTDGNLIASSTALDKPMFKETDGKFLPLRADDSGLPLVEAAARVLEEQEGGLAGVGEHDLLSFELNDDTMYLQAALFEPAPGLQWVLAVAVPEFDLMGRIDANTRQVIGAIAAVLLLAVALGVYIAKRIAAPIEGLSQDADTLAQGDWTVSPRPTSIREIDKLSSAFLSMGGQLQSYFAALTEQKELIEAQNQELEERVAERTSSLNDANSRLRAFFENIPGHINIVDTEFRIIGVSRGLLEAFGIEDSETLLGRKCHEALQGKLSTCDQCSLTECFRTKQPAVRYSTPEEEESTGKALQIYSGPILDNEDNVIGGMEYVADISDLRAMEKQLMAAKEAAEAASLAKSVFLARMSHEIRTPMNAILGMAELTLQTRLANDQREYLETLQSSAEHLLAIINDILDLSKIEADRLELSPENFELRKCLQATMHTLEHQAQTKNLVLTSHVDEDVPDVLRGDQAKLRQIIINLTGNAIKFTETGSVAVNIHSALPDQVESEVDAQSAALQFRVEDTGPGVPEDARESIFNVFTQAEGSAARRHGGTGLGLAISRRLVALMGGNIWVEERPSGGSIFVFTVVLALGDPARLPQQSAYDCVEPVASVKPLRILVAEDTPVNIRLTVQFLKRLGHEASVAHNGQEALDSLKSLDFDLVLMDIEMPDMNGLEATKRIRAGEAGGRNVNIPIIGLTAHALSEYRERGLAAGMNDYVFKPVSFARLRSAISRVMTHCLLSQRTENCAVAPDDAPVLDLDQARLRFGGDDDLLLDVVAQCLTELPDKMDGLKTAIDAHAASDAAIAAHSLKSNLSTIGAQEAMLAAMRLEKVLMQPDDGDASELVGQLEVCLERLQAQAADIIAQTLGQKGCAPDRSDAIAKLADTLQKETGRFQS